MGFAQDMPDNQGGKTLMFALWPKPLSDDEKEYFGLDDTADAVQRVLAEHEGNISATARALGMHRRTLQRKLQKRPVRR